MKLIKRRALLKKAALASTTSVIGLTAEAKKDKKVFVHHVYFWLKNPASEADRKKLIEGLTALAKVPTIRMHNIGTPAGTVLKCKF